MNPERIIGWVVVGAVASIALVIAIPFILELMPYIIGGLAFAAILYVGSQLLRR